MNKLLRNVVGSTTSKKMGKFGRQSTKASPSLHTGAMFNATGGSKGMHSRKPVGNQFRPKVNMSNKMGVSPAMKPRAPLNTGVNKMAKMMRSKGGRKQLLSSGAMLGGTGLTKSRKSRQRGFNATRGNRIGHA